MNMKISIYIWIIFNLSLSSAKFFQNECNIIKNLQAKLFLKCVWLLVDNFGKLMDK